LQFTPSGRLVAIGDFSLKLHSSYLAQHFSYLPTTASGRYIPGITKHSKTPPYLIAKPDIKYIDLQDFRNYNPILLLFTDGIDLLASGGFDGKAV
jgi:pyruvate dehydrogenase phosphatase